ncbi:hypothetical protein [Paenibacillus peoriae]|uniref:hypothetical protein n=1 Tax=Paenibacillus TaxID=44249 RepID=UPI0015C3F3E6
MGGNVPACVIPFLLVSIVIYRQAVIKLEESSQEFAALYTCFRHRSKRILSSGKRWSYYINKDTLTTSAAAAAPGTDPPGCRRYLNFWRYNERLRIRERRFYTGFCRAS